MNELQIFENAEFGSIRTLEVEGEPYFVGKDVAEVLGYVNPTKAIREKIDDEDKLMSKMDTSFGEKDTYLINESSLYSLILSSKLPTAKKFKRWVTSEVLPAIRKTGGYVADDEKFIGTYLPNADEATRLMFKANLEAIKSLNNKVGLLEVENAQQKQIIS
ncbi:MAG: BRO family protein, partial [Acutalibacteraceae bacterium]|nr:BRO family protein [Acutalibacteraceae bacterium]